MIGFLAPLSRLAVAVRPEGARALDTREILEHFHELGAKAIEGGTVRHGVATALREARNEEPILVTGSHFVVGELLKSLNSGL